MQKYEIAKLDDLKNFARHVLNTYTRPTVFCLVGDLGAGKTTFTKFFCEYLNVDQTVNSPTFIIHNEYTSSEHEGTIHHIDLYRVEKDTELDELQLKERFKDTDFLLIEWADKFEKKILRDFKDYKILWLDFEHGKDQDSRAIIATEIDP